MYGRIPLVFSGMLCAIGVMWIRSPALYILGVVMLFISMSFDLVDGWFAARFRPNPTLAQLADRLMDKVLYSIIFPLIAAGMMWRLIFFTPTQGKLQLLHAIFVLLLCVTVLIRDNFASFMRGFALRKGQEPERSEFTRLRTIVAAPVSALLYAHAFYIPQGPSLKIYSSISWLANLPLRDYFLIEIIFMIINFGSIAAYCRKYGSYCLDDLCLGDEYLRRRILAFFPNALTLMNAMMGLMAVFFAYQSRVREAFLLLIGAALFDKLDGALARRLGLTQPLEDADDNIRHVNFGSIMDDVADAVSFCMAPALIFYITLSSSPDTSIQSLPIGIVAMAYLGLGIMRLIYFTLDKNPIPGFFKGFPSPAAALLVVSPLIMYNRALSGMSQGIHWWGVFCFSLMIFASILMNVYPIRYLHFGRLMGRHPWFTRIFLLVVFFFIFTPYFGYFSLAMMAIYVLSPILTGKVDSEVAARETRKTKSGS